MDTVDTPVYQESTVTIWRIRTDRLTVTAIVLHDRIRRRGILGIETTAETVGLDISAATDRDLFTILKLAGYELGPRLHLLYASRERLPLFKSQVITVYIYCFNISLEGWPSRTR